MIEKGPVAKQPLALLIFPIALRWLVSLNGIRGNHIAQAQPSFSSANKIDFGATWSNILIVADRSVAAR